MKTFCNRWPIPMLAATFAASAFCLSPAAYSAPPAPAQVYIGTIHGWSDLLAHPDQWNYVRTHADGFYANFIQLLPTVGDPGALCRQTAPLMTHKNALFESDSRYTGLGGFPNGGQFTLKTQAQELQELLRAGFKVTYTSLNYGVDNAKLTQCRTLGLPAGVLRPCLAQNGPWMFGGDIRRNVQDNAKIRKDILRTEGQSTDGPLALWASNQGQMQAGSASVSRYAHIKKKLSLVMISPGDLPAKRWLATAQQCVRFHENRNASPDIWADYAYDTQTPTLPEANADGTPANTVMGAAYWLIHHLTDPAHCARLRVLPVPHSRPHGPQIVNMVLHNDSTWLDLTPVLLARIDDPGHAWTVRVRLGGKDITPAVTQEGGYVFLKDQRLWPKASKRLEIVMKAKRPSARPHPMTLHLTLLAHPGHRDIVNQTLTLHATAIGVTTPR